MVRNYRLHLTRHYMMMMVMLCYANFNLHYIKTYVIIYISGNRLRKNRGRINKQQTSDVSDDMKMMTLMAITRCKIIQVLSFTSNTDTNPASITLMHAVEHTWECPHCRRPILRLL